MHILVQSVDTVEHLCPIYVQVRPKTTKQSNEIHLKSRLRTFDEELWMEISQGLPDGLTPRFWGMGFCCGLVFCCQRLMIFEYYFFVWLCHFEICLSSCIFFVFEWGEVMKRFGWKCKNRFLFVGMDLVKISTSYCDWLRSINIEKTRCSNNHVATNTALVGKDLLEVC